MRGGLWCGWVGLGGLRARGSAWAQGGLGGLCARGGLCMCVCGLVERGRRWWGWVPYCRSVKRY